jgi:hypothetical protein
MHADMCAAVALLRRGDSAARRAHERRSQPLLDHGEKFL